MTDKFCSKCGAYIRPGAAYCPDCGMKVTGDNTLEFESSVPSLPEKKKTKFPVWLIVLLFLAASAIIVFAFVRISQKSNTSSQEIIDIQLKTPAPAVTVTESPAVFSSSQETPQSAVSEAILELYPDGDPVYEDFDWYYNDIRVNGIPEGAVKMNPSDLNGSWKYLFHFEIDAETGSWMEEIGYANISQYASKADFSPWPLLIRDDTGSAEEENAEEVGYEPFEGTVDEAGFHLSGNGCTMEISSYYQYQEVQYAIGSMITGSGYGTDVLLVRP